MNKYPVVYLNGFMYADCFLSTAYTGKRKHVFCTAPGNDFGGLRMNCETGFCEMCRDVIASNDFQLKELPILETEGILYIYPKNIDTLYTDYCETVPSKGVVYKHFLAGYKASKKHFTEEDMIELAKHITFKSQRTTNTEFYDYDQWTKQFIQSLNLKPIAVEFEMNHEFKNLPDQQQWQEMTGSEKMLYAVTTTPKVENNIAKVVKWVYE